MGLFGKAHQRDPKEVVQEITRNLNKEGRGIERQIRSIEREQEKVKRSLKDAAKKNQKDVCLILAKEIVNSKKAVKRLHTSKAQMSSVSMQMKNQLSVLRVTGALQKSTEVMKSMQNLVKMPELQASMMEMSKEMMKAGIIEEMLEDTFESLDDQEELDEAAQDEVDKILFEITAGALGNAPSAATNELPTPVGASVDVESEEEEEEVENMQARLEALRS